MNLVINPNSIVLDGVEYARKGELLPEEMARRREIMAASDVGADIEYRLLKDSDVESSWAPATTPSWSWGDRDYRIKPKDKAPVTPEHLLKYICDQNKFMSRYAVMAGAQRIANEE